MARVGLTIFSPEGHGMSGGEDKLVRELWNRGHFWNPFLSGQVTESDLPRLRASDAIVKEAVRSYADFDTERYSRHVARIHNRAPWNDGEFGPAVAAMVDESGTERCPVPDYAPPPNATFHYEDSNLQAVVEKMQNDAQRAVGGGSWARCHDVGDFHCAIVRVDDRNCPAGVRPYLLKIQANVQKAIASVGLLIRYVDSSGRDILNGDDLSDRHVNIDVEWTRGDGWIGLAIVGQGEGCTTQPIWAKFDTVFVGGQSESEIVINQTTLHIHEHLHNMGFGHTRGGVLNPSLVRGLAVHFGPTDPITGPAKQRYGGVPVPIPGGSGPGPDAPDDSLEQQIRFLQWENRIQQKQIDRLFALQRAIPPR